MTRLVVYPYFGPNRRFGRPVVEVRLESDATAVVRMASETDIARQLQAWGLSQELPTVADLAKGSATADAALLLARTALALQKAAGHAVEYVAPIEDSRTHRGLAVFEHIDGRVGQAAAELAGQLVLAQESLTSAHWDVFRQLAKHHARSAETAAILAAAGRRGIPVIDLDREPLQGKMRLPTQFRPNGHLWLGQGRTGRLLDGSFPLDRMNNRVMAMMRNPGQRATLLGQAGAGSVQAPAGSQLLAIGDLCWDWPGQPGDGGPQPAGDIDIGLPALLEAIRTDTGALALLLSTNEVGQILDFDMVPDLGQLTQGLAEATDALMVALFPDETPFRVPVVAITGSNGKTTTCRLTRHLLAAAGHTVGLVCTDAIFIGDQKVHDQDSGAFAGHAGVLTNRQVNAAVLENHHRGIAVRGFAFDHEVISVLLNVTEEHLVPGEIETVEEMAEVKGALLRHSRNAAVLFADDARCRSLIPGITARTLCLVSLEQDIEALRALAGEKEVTCCLLERHEGETWISFYQGGDRTLVLPVGDAPFTFGGQAPTTTSNTLHATAAARLAGLGWDAIRAGLRTFVPGPEMTPGRMNWYDHLPFGLLQDVAHNADGFAKLCAFSDNLNSEGQKVIAFAGVSKRPDDHNRRTAEQVAGHFDRYICKEIQPSKPPKKRYVAPLMRDALVDFGVDPDAITVTTFGREVIFEILDSCAPGDLLVLVTGINESRNIPAWVAEYSAERGYA